MYLSHLMIDVGSNPDRPRPGRLWLRNIYHVHQRLSMAFPTRQQRAGDPRFLRAFDPAGFEPRFDKHKESTLFLFRIDNSIEEDCPRAMILLQSQVLPDWDYAFHNARMFLAAAPKIREYNPTFRTGEEFRFRIRINLSKRSCQHPKTLDKTDAAGRPQTRGKRVALTWEEGQRPDQAIREWFARKGAQKGFELRGCDLLHLGWVGGHRPRNERSRETQAEGGNPASQMKFRAALLEGMLTVIDAPWFAQAVASGIGSAKAFGFGLLSLARVGNRFLAEADT
jgi:CRISPR system Cascade subunit CasE